MNTMNNATALYALSLSQVSAAILAGGHKRTVLVQGHMGTGKTSLLYALGQMLPDHILCYFDCTTKDVGDIAIPSFHRIDEQGYVTYVPNEELGIHLGKDVIVCVDEFGKAPPSVQKAMLRFMLERKLYSLSLTDKSIVFATTNKGSEGVGDMLPAHACNRITVLQTAKPTNLEWIEWGLNNGIDHTLLGWCRDTPQLFASYEDYPDNMTRDDFERENPYIYHPKFKRASFVTPRSLHAASDWLKERYGLDNQTLVALLMGTIGERAAMDLMTFVNLADQLPTIESIKASPMTAKLPDLASARCMVVYKVLGAIERDWVDAWMTYLSRMDKETQALFSNSVRAKTFNPKKQSMIMTNGSFTQWARDNQYMFTTDKR